MPTEDQYRAARVGASVELADVLLALLNFQLEEPDAEPPFQLDGSWDTRWDRQESTLVYEVRFTFSALGSRGERVFNAAVAYFIGYYVPDGFVYSEEEAEAFGALTARFTAHPYIRETVQSVTARAGLPPLVLGVLRVPIEASPEEETSSTR